MDARSVRDAYTRWAPHYDTTHAGTLPKRREARLALEVRPGDRVLDLACGTGLNLPHLREMVGEGGQVVGVDLTPAMLEIARQRISQNGWNNVKVREADAAALPLADGSFDQAICTYAMNVIPQYVRAIEEVGRVLVPGGRFVSLELGLAVKRLPGWLARLPHPCAVDITHQTLTELRRVFAQVQVRRYYLGLIFLAVATKR
jgi:demethylmenaquinone methyltransferase/2-methoxy-6-polyprenyl-1,4-benzoquinol methylase